MILLQEKIRVSFPIEEAFRYTADFSHIEQWDPGVVSSVKRTDGSVGVGTEYDLDLRYGIMKARMIYRIVEFNPPRKIVLEGVGDSFQARDTIQFSATESGTDIDYQAEIRFEGRKSRLEPLLKPLLVRIGRASMAGLQDALSTAVVSPNIKPLDLLADKAILPGMLGFSRVGYALNRKWFQPNPASLIGKTVVITGATSGIGKAAAFKLAESDARLALVSRNRKKADDLKSKIAAMTGNRNIGLYHADISLLADVKKVAKELLQKESSVDILINNAGALFNRRSKTTEGIESTLATDLLGPFYLTQLLMPGLTANRNSRIINVSSGGMYTQKIDLEDLQNSKPPYNGEKAYARAKRGLVILTELWADRLKEKGVIVHAMHPGWVETKGVIESLPGFYRITRPILRTPDQGADTIVWLASSREAGLVTGKFWFDRRPRITHVFPGTRETAQERELLWRALSRMAGGEK